MKGPTKHAALVLVTIMAFLCATVLAVTRGAADRISQNEWLFNKQATAVSCIKNVPADGSSGDNNNGSGCAHQLGASCLLTIGGDRRNKTYSC
jgi:hypothetical protein